MIEAIYHKPEEGYYHASFPLSEYHDSVIWEFSDIPSEYAVDEIERWISVQKNIFSYVVNIDPFDSEEDYIRFFFTEESDLDDIKEFMEQFKENNDTSS